MPFIAPEESLRGPTILATLSGILRKLGPAWWVVLASSLLSLIGIHAIDVAEVSTTGGRLGPLATRQMVFWGAGTLLAGVVMFARYRKVGEAAWVFFILGLLSLVFLILPGIPISIVRPRGGARAWINIGTLTTIQPSEFVKIAYVVALAWYLRYRKNHRTFVGLIPPAIITAIPVVLIMLQPDLGTAILFIPALFAVLLVAGAKLKHLALIVLCACLAAPASYPLLRPHQRQRIHGLFMQIRGDDREDLDINMQAVTAQRLIGAGGVLGVGEEQARKLHRFNALPERHNDMIFAVVCTRWGMFGGVVVIGLFLLWAAGAILTSARCPEPFGRLLCVGLLGFMGTQVIINIGMNLGLLPIIGITLPYVSNGGSSLLAQWIVTGLIASVALRRPGWEMGRSFEWDDE